MSELKRTYIEEDQIEVQRSRNGFISIECFVPKYRIENNEIGAIMTDDVVTADDSSFPRAFVNERIFLKDKP